MKIKYYVLDKSHTSRKTTRLISTTFDTRMTPPRAAISSIEFQIGVGGSVSRAWHERWHEREPKISWKDHYKKHL